MIRRYVRPEMGSIWEDKNKYETWLKVELAVLEAKVELGLFSPEALKHIKSRVGFTVEEIEEMDKQIEHDMNAFIAVVQKSLDPYFAGEFHKGLTSYDVEEPALALLLVQSSDIIIEDVKNLMSAVMKKAKEHKKTVMIGRTHGQHAQPITFGLKLLNWYYSLEIDLKMVEQAREMVGYGKISGAVGTYPLGTEIELSTCLALNIKPAKISTQILSRNRHAQLMSALAITAATVEQIATEIRLLSQTEIGEAREPFKKKQKGSSAMPHKKNPILCERLVGQARVIRGNLISALENVATWSERDISQSSVERVIFPDSFQLLDYMLTKLTWVIEGMEVFPSKMQENIRLTYGIFASQSVRNLLLEKGADPEESYRLIQELCFKAQEEKQNLFSLLLRDERTAGYFQEQSAREELKKSFSPLEQLKCVDQVFARFGE